MFKNHKNKHIPASLKNDIKHFNEQNYEKKSLTKNEYKKITKKLSKINFYEDLSDTGSLESSDIDVRAEWCTQSNAQIIRPLKIFEPDNLYEIIEILEDAVENNLSVKAVGSGHSYSDCVHVDDYLIKTFDLNKISDPTKPISGQLSPELIKDNNILYTGEIIQWNEYDPENNTCLIEMESGVRLKNLTNFLDDKNLALINMGGYDGQTIAGVISTSTHGSGINIGPFCDMVKSLILVTTGKWYFEDDNIVNVYRIEPTHGITDPEKWNHPLIKLVQDDDCFYSTVCNMGCFGIIYSVTLNVMQKYYLQEERTLSTLDKILKELQPNFNNPQNLPDILLNNRHCEILIHPYPMKKNKIIEIDPDTEPSVYWKNIKVLITCRNIVKKPNKKSLIKKSRNPFLSLIQNWGGTFQLLSFTVNNIPKIIPLSITESMKTLVDKKYVDIYHDILVLDLDGNAGVAAEVSFPVEDENDNYTPDYFINAINEIHKICHISRTKGEQYNTSAFSLRFVKNSDAHMSMSQGYNSAFIELDMLIDTYGHKNIFHRFEKNMYKFNGRPHWGLDYDVNTGKMVRKIYPKFKRWYKVYKKFNNRGTFDNRFTDRIGLSSYK